MKIRLATYDDPIERFAELGRKDHERCAYAGLPYCEGSVIQMLVTMIDEQMLLIAEDGGAVVGGIGARMFPLEWNLALKVGVMRFWWVDTPYQKTRLAMRLLKEMEIRAIVNGCDVWMLCSVDSGRDQPLTRLFDRAGYTLAERTYIKSLK